MTTGFCILLLALALFAVGVKRVGSPYPWRQSLRWPWLLLFPSTRDRSGLAPVRLLPRAGRLDGDAGHTILLVGDLMYTRGGVVPEATEAVRALFGRADLIVGNCECSVHEADRNRFELTRFNLLLGRKYVADVLRALAADPGKVVFTLANNHCTDAGIEGFHTTRRILDGLVAGTTGYRREDGRLAYAARLGTLTVGVLGWTQWIRRQATGTIGPVLRQEEILPVCPRELKQREGLDLLLGSPHWGYEFVHFPEPETVTAAHGFLAGGMDLLAGHHPHVVQPVEVVEDRLVFYSLGNFVAGVPSWPTHLVGVGEVRLSPEGARCGHRLHLLVLTRHGGVQRLQRLEELEGADRRRYLRRARAVFGDDAVSG